MRVTNKGQITIPKPIREKLGLSPGAEVRVVERLGEIVVSVPGGTPPVSRRSRIEQGLEKRRAQLDSARMNGLDYTDWLRGERDDVLPG